MRKVYLLAGWGFSPKIWDSVDQQLRLFCEPIYLDVWNFFKVVEGNEQNPFDQLLESLYRATDSNSVWLAWSMSGLLVTELAERYPGHIAGIVNVASTPKFVTDTAWHYAIQLQAFEEFQLRFRQSPVETLRQFSRLVLAGDRELRSWRKNVGDYLIDAETCYKQLCQGLKIMSQQDNRQTLANLTIPCLFVLGEEDALLDSKKLDSNILNTDCHVIEGASHAAFLGHSEEFCEQINNFLMKKIK